MRNTHLIRLGLLILLPALMFGEVIEDVTIDTTPLAGVSGFLAFDLIGGSPFQLNTVTVTNFATTGTLGAASGSGDVTGSLTAPPVVLTASAFFNEFLQPITFAGGLTTFRLAMTTNFSGSFPDEFSFFLLDSTFAPFATSDPSGANALVVRDLMDSVSTVSYTSDFASVRIEPVTSSAVPEPALGLPLTLICGVLLARARRRMR